MIKPVIIWTDYFVFVLLIAVALVFYLAHQQKLIGRWQHLYQRPSRMIAMLLLLFFVVIAVLDSLHYRVALQRTGDDTVDYSATVYSVLDKILLPVAINTEKTYSKPFAHVLFVPEWQPVVDPAGDAADDTAGESAKATTAAGSAKLAWVQPRLNFGGAHLHDATQIWPDVAYISTIVGLCKPFF